MNPRKGDPREVIIDQHSDVRVCDGTSVVKVRFAGKKIKDVLENDISLSPLPPVVPLSELYNNVERYLSHSLQPGIGYRELLKEVTTARDELRKIMRKMGWKGQF